MVVLLRAFTHVAAFEEALERAGLAPYVVGGRGYWSQQQVEDVLRLLGVIANPLDDESLFGALASPAVRVSPDTLWLLRRAAALRGPPRARLADRSPAGEWPAGMPAEDARATRAGSGTILAAPPRARRPLLAARLAASTAPISAFDYDLALLREPEGGGGWRTCASSCAWRREYEAHEGRDLRGFLDFAEERTRRDEREGMAASRRRTTTAFG